MLLRSIGFVWEASSEREKEAAPAESTDSEALSRRYLRTALRLIDAWTRAMQARLMLVYVPAEQPRFATANREIPGILRELAAEMGDAFVDATPALTDDRTQAKQGTRLPNDGHLTADGAQLVADTIASQLRAHGLLDAPLRTELSVGSVWVRLNGSWGIERDEGGQFAWTKAESQMEITGLPAGKLTMNLLVRHTTPNPELNVILDSGRTFRLLLESPGRYSLPEAVAADARGHLSLRLTSRPWRASSSSASRDDRDLGVGLGGVEFSESQ